MTLQNAAEYSDPNEEERELIDFNQFFDHGRLHELELFVRSQCSDRTVAEEVVQDTLVVALAGWEKVGRYRKPMGWLIKTARSKLIRAMRNAAARRGRFVGLEVVVAEPFREPTNDAEAELLFLDLMNRLSRRQSEVLSLSWLDLSDREIAQMLEITPATVRSHREAARKRLQAFIDNGLGYSEGD